MYVSEVKFSYMDIRHNLFYNASYYIYFVTLYSVFLLGLLFLASYSSWHLFVVRCSSCDKASQLTRTWPALNLLVAIIGYRTGSSSSKHARSGCFIHPTSSKHQHIIYIVFLQRGKCEEPSLDDAFIIPLLCSHLHMKLKDASACSSLVLLFASSSKARRRECLWFLSYLIVYIIGINFKFKFQQAACFE
jgi:hypothetical protein